MATWSKQQIAIFARSAGWGKRSEDAAEVAMAESSGRDNIVNSIGCVGLMQINQPVHVKAHPKWTVAWLKDPIHNMEAALVLYKGAGNKWDGPWLDSRDKGSGGGWGGKVSGSSGGTQQIGDDPCKGLEGRVKDMCEESQDSLGKELPNSDPLGLEAMKQVATQLGRLAQMGAKAGNWLGEPGSWVRVAYVVGGAALGLTAVAVIIRPYTAGAYRQVSAALPVKTTKRIVRAARERSSSEESTSE
ncbi:transglycosylase SLT domain-containing protein [Streptomyces sp. NBC_00470]|uniref:transglycosylase SLT domain-containing protein n=1 Tax=Streptomyces sp. NBC_00470 TaxID=2975753 RepID=UPI0030E4BB86